MLEHPQKKKRKKKMMTPILWRKKKKKKKWDLNKKWNLWNLEEEGTLV